jgi:hypothetical protein
VLAARKVPGYHRCFEQPVEVTQGRTTYLGTTGSDDAPSAIQSTATAMNSALCVLDWIFSGILDRLPGLRICIAESQIGWTSYFVQRADQIWDQHRGYNDVWDMIKIRPSTFRRNISCTFFDDPVRPGRPRPNRC